MSPTSTLEKLVLKATRKTPSIDFNNQTGILEIKGRSLPDDNHKFFAPLITWTEKYVKSNPAKTTLNIEFEYLQTGAALKIFEIVKLLKKLQASGKPVTVNWYYEEDDDDMMQTGMDFASVIGMHFNFDTFRN